MVLKKPVISLLKANNDEIKKLPGGSFLIYMYLPVTVLFVPWAFDFAFADCFPVFVPCP
jgi:hypothetical protein